GRAPDRRARIRHSVASLDRDRRREVGDRVDLGSGQALEEEPRVRRERRDVASLSLGVEGVEGERRLARAPDARERGQRREREAAAGAGEGVPSRAADLDRPGGRTSRGQKSSPASGSGSSKSKVTLM